MVDMLTTAASNTSGWGTIARRGLAPWLVLVLVVGCASGSPAAGDGPTGVVTYADEWGGSATVYAEIAASSDCEGLQETFDRSAANNDGAQPGTAEHKWTLGYMQASQSRMQAIGC